MSWIIGVFISATYIQDVNLMWSSKSDKLNRPCVFESLFKFCEIKRFELMASRHRQCNAAFVWLNPVSSNFKIHKTAKSRKLGDLMLTLPSLWARQTTSRVTLGAKLQAYTPDTRHGRGFLYTTSVERDHCRDVHMSPGRHAALVCTGSLLWRGRFVS